MLKSGKGGCASGIVSSRFVSTERPELGANLLLCLSVVLDLYFGLLGGVKCLYSAD